MSRIGWAPQRPLHARVKLKRWHYPLVAPFATEQPTQIGLVRQRCHSDGIVRSNIRSPQLGLHYRSYRYVVSQVRRCMKWRIGMISPNKTAVWLHAWCRIFFMPAVDWSPSSAARITTCAVNRSEAHYWKRRLGIFTLAFASEGVEKWRIYSALPLAPTAMKPQLATLQRTARPLRAMTSSRVTGRIPNIEH